MPHSPARWTLYGRPESSRLLKVHHYMLHLRIKMGLGAYASSRQDTDYTGGGVVRSSWERPIIRGTAALTSVCIQAHLSRCLTCQVPGPSTLRSSATRAFKAPLRSYGNLGRDRQRNRGLFVGMVRGVSNPREGSKMLIFLSWAPTGVCRTHSYISEACGRCIVRTTALRRSPKFAKKSVINTAIE
jgi:hypothetical protein